MFAAKIYSGKRKNERKSKMQINLLSLEDLVKLRKQITLKSQDLSDYEITITHEQEESK